MGTRADLDRELEEAQAALLATYGNTTGISVYIALACLVSLVSVWWLKETYRDAM